MKTITLASIKILKYTLRFRTSLFFVVNNKIKNIRHHFMDDKFLTAGAPD